MIQLPQKEFPFRLFRAIIASKGGIHMDIAFGTKILNHQTNEIGLLIKTWLNKFADQNIWYATCVDKNGKRYNIELDKITPLSSN